MVLMGRSSRHAGAYRRGPEIFLKAPWENGGEHYSVDLLGDDILVLATKRQLERAFPDGWPANHQPIEDLGPKEADYFGVSSTWYDSLSEFVRKPAEE